VRRAGDRPFGAEDEDVLARFARLVGMAAERTSHGGEVHRDPDVDGKLRDDEQLLADLRCALRVSVPPARPVAVVLVGLRHGTQLRAEGRPADAEALLQRVAAVIQDVVRPGDRVYRWRNDELAVMLPETPRGHAMRVIVRLRDLLVATVEDAGGDRETVLIGWAIGDAPSPIKLVQRARSVMTPPPAKQARTQPPQAEPTAAAQVRAEQTPADQVQADPVQAEQTQADRAAAA